MLWIQTLLFTEDGWSLLLSLLLLISQLKILCLKKSSNVYTRQQEYRLQEYFTFLFVILANQFFFFSKVFPSRGYRNLTNISHIFFKHTAVRNAPCSNATISLIATACSFKFRRSQGMEQKPSISSFKLPLKHCLLTDTQICDILLLTYAYSDHVDLNLKEAHVHKNAENCSYMSIH